MNTYLLHHKQHCRLAVFFLDGQKIAIRLARRITVVNKMLKKSLAFYNSGIDESSHLQWSDAADLSSHLYRDCLYSDSDVPAAAKYQAVQLYHQINRAKEEEARIRSEMKNCADHYISMYEALMKQVEEYESQEQLDLCGLGKLCLLKRAKTKCIIKLRSLECFYQHTDLEQLKAALLTFSDELSG